MSEWISELAKRLVVSRKRDGRCVYDAQAKHELILACKTPGISMARLARECGVNANQLSTWVRKHDEHAGVAAPNGDAVESTAPAFVPVHIEAPRAQSTASVQMQAHLPNGVVVDFSGCDVQHACELIQALGRLPCSASTKA